MAIDMDMDLIQTQTRTRTPDSDTDTPPRNPPSKRVHHTLHAHHAPYVSYKECMKNHAATIGGHALDGCCEFMPGPNFTLLDPTSLKCGACGCHRNFHRRDPDDPTPLNHHHAAGGVAHHSPPSASQLLLSLSRSPSGPSEDDGKMVISPPRGAWGGQNGNFSRKRFRTKFSQEQKERMYEFSEKIGWKLKKGDEKLIEEFVKVIGVERSVFKVWMHNNKHTSSSSTTTAGVCKVISDNINRTTTPPPLDEVEGVGRSSNATTATTTVNYMVQPKEEEQQSSSNGSKSSTHVGNCGTSLFDNNNINMNMNMNNHRQFNFGNGGGQDNAQAQLRV